MNPPNLNALWAQNLVKALVAGGVRDVCLTPGSRSTPLVWGAHHEPELTVHLHLDERASAFFALGVAKTTGRPVALVCTSGTAAANYFPAVIEASLSGVPLVVVSADRPLELRGTGASQTIDQVRLFGVHARDYLETPLPVADLAALRRAHAGVRRAVATAMQAPRGPVQINVPFADPLPPTPADDPRLAELASALESRPLGWTAGPALVSPAAVDALASMLCEHPHGWIVAGPEALHPEALLELGRRLGYPVLADVASGVRFVEDPAGVRCTFHEGFLRSPSMTAEPPEIVLRVGGLPTSATLNRCLAALRPQVIELQPDGMRRDPDALAGEVLVGEVGHTLTLLLERLEGLRADCAWLERYRAADRAAAEAAATWGASAVEAQAVAEAIAMMPAGSEVFLSSSMPIRYAEALASRGASDLRVHVSRGANGIDGIVSTALGIAVGSARPTLLVTGDLAALHDVGGMLAARLLHSPFVALVINNDGGGIFSHLPISGHPELFEPYFGTPHGLEFAPAATMYRWQHDLAAHLEEIGPKIELAAAIPGATLIELSTRRTDEALAYQALLARMAGAVSPPVEVGA